MVERQPNQWLDLETKACLQQSPPSKLAPPTTRAFSVVVLRVAPSPGHSRHVRAFERVLRTSHTDAEFQTTRHVPFVVKRELTLADAMLAQFEFICCDIISVFISDEVLSNAESQYLADLYNTLIHSDEFATVALLVTHIPPNEAGNEFFQQFIGDRLLPLPHKMMATQKKARIMTHWARKVGAVVGSGAPI